MTEPINLQYGVKQIRLGAHPVLSKKGIKNECRGSLRAITFEDWILYIILENKHKLPWNKK